jgi:hypothetical protein
VGVWPKRLEEEGGFLGFEGGVAVLRGVLLHGGRVGWLWGELREMWVGLCRLSGRVWVCVGGEERRGGFGEWMTRGS